MRFPHDDAAHTTKTPVHDHPYSFDTKLKIMINIDVGGTGQNGMYTKTVLCFTSHGESICWRSRVERKKSLEPAEGKKESFLPTLQPHCLSDSQSAFCATFSARRLASASPRCVCDSRSTGKSKKDGSRSSSSTSSIPARRFAVPLLLAKSPSAVSSLVLTNSLFYLSFRVNIKRSVNYIMKEESSA